MNLYPGFTINEYVELLILAMEHGYNLLRFENEDDCIGKKIILRHDVDVSVEKASIMAKYEYENGICSTYFVMVSSPFYNILDSRNRQFIKTIEDYGNEIGLHFDVTNYPVYDLSDLERYVMDEVRILETVTGRKIRCISWHIPDLMFLGREISFLKIHGIKNTYSPRYFQSFEYCSDSSMKWRKSPTYIINEGNKNKIQLLTHPIWYSEDGLVKCKETIMTDELDKKNSKDCQYLKKVLGF